MHEATPLHISGYPTYLYICMDRDAAAILIIFVCRLGVRKSVGEMGGDCRVRRCFGGIRGESSILNSRGDYNLGKI